MRLVNFHMAISVVLGSLCSIAHAAEDEKVLLSSCIDSQLEKLTSAQSREFTSPQFRVVCYRGEVVDNPPRCKRDDKDETFTFEAPVGYQIYEAEFNLVSKTFRSEVGTFESSENSASISLHCRAGCDDSAHVGVGGNIVGYLIYQPSALDAKNAALECLGQVIE